MMVYWGVDAFVSCRFQTNFWGVPAHWPTRRNYYYHFCFFLQFSLFAAKCQLQFPFRLPKNTLILTTQINPMQSIHTYLCSCIKLKGRAWSVECNSSCQTTGRDYYYLSGCQWTAFQISWSGDVRLILLSILQFKIHFVPSLLTGPKMLIQLFNIPSQKCHRHFETRKQ